MFGGNLSTAALYSAIFAHVCGNTAKKLRSPNGQRFEIGNIGHGPSLISAIRKRGCSSWASHRQLMARTARGGCSLAIAAVIGSIGRFTKLALPTNQPLSTHPM